MQKRNTTFYLTEEAHKLIQRLARERGISKNALVEEAIKSLDPLTQNRTDDDLRSAKEETLFELRDQVQFLRRELERKDTIIMALTQRVPELEATPEPRGSPVRASEDDTSTSTDEPSGDPETANNPPWWRRLIGG